MAKVDTAKIAKNVFEEIASAFPNLKSRIHEDEPVELSMDIPKQDGLDFDIKLNNQNYDELHFGVGYFWCGWFPCTDRQKVEEYKKSVIGFIAGDYRILEHLRGRRAVKAELQVPKNESWITVASSSWGLPWPFPRQKTYRVVQNTNLPGEPDGLGS
ncbi:MAG: hypothetical protein O7A03_10995 [Alphaproteobacteria bacterium]|nr:hypothetical protein [Alphaproteobacteria bacterium]